MHIEKYNRSTVGHMIEHYERNPRIYKTQKHINPELTKFNYTLGNDKLTGMAKYQKILATPGLKVMNRADVNTLVDVVLTLPKAEYFPQERFHEFFTVAYKFLLKTFCNNKEDFLVGCYYHADESKGNAADNFEQSDTIVKGQGHIHFSFVPVISHNNMLKVCAKQVIDRKLLKRLHGDLSKHMESHFGFDVGILNGATKEGNLTVQQLREQTRKYNELVKYNEKLQSENEQLKLELAENMHNLKIWQQEEGITPTFELLK